MERKRVVAIVFLVFVVIVLPLILISDWGLGKIEGLALSHPDLRWAAWLQFKTATIYYITARPEKRLETYENFLRVFPNTDERYPEAYYMRAVCIESISSRQRAIGAYNEFIFYYPDHPLSKEADKAIERLRLSR